MVRKSASQIISEKTLGLRQSFWPKITDEMLWHRKRKTGYTTIPRTMTYIMQIMNSLSSGKPLSQTYMVLWCHTFDEYMVTVANPKLMAFEAGFTGQRAEAAWTDRMKKLQELGFIDAKPGASGIFNYVLILNPYEAIKKLKEKKGAIPENIFNTFLQRVKEIGANDLD